MNVAVEFIGYIGVLTKEKRSEFAMEGDTLKDLVASLCERYPALAGYNQRGYKLSVNRQIIPVKQWSDTRLQESDEIAIFAFLAGG